ncbi:P-loop containing nucleoside triphosphate hydrolase protein [Pholiota conissans]|uniref:P-loop containing nucleoside triphosphate hydrolase protein n=1 Tax=Pholiota conissans TaxID=109636 RepID=A0A9P5Z5A4_9AGAR|nr:P-loop containing nucleoside triphosphate hydrolase protein [Pholiota conissans]
MASKLVNSDMEDFVNVWTDADGEKPSNIQTDFYGQWAEHSSAKQAIPPVIGADALRKLHPNHSLIMTNGYGMNILGFPAASVTPMANTPLITNLFFVPLSRSMGIPGLLVDQVEYGSFKLNWNQFDFIVYAIQYPQGFGILTQYFILHEGPEEVSRLYLLSAGAWADSLHDEIWVFNQGFWQKDHGLWQEVQKADWKDVILKDVFKKALQKDVYGFFASEAVYKELAIPWKRGLIMWGPPGNGKTISLKTIMKTCGEKGFAPLYVKSFQSWKGEEGAMADVFNKARQLSPCVVILEDLDSLINDRNRSFFLNQMDGLEGNDGLLVIGTTNHFERLDPGLSTRPSRFDRKYKFDDPDEEERKLYVQYWQKKLGPNREIEFPDRLINKVARLTDRFSFAYLKEAFVSSLVTLAGIETEKPTFESVLLHQIETLRKQLDKEVIDFQANFEMHSGASKVHHLSPTRHPRPNSSNEYDIYAMPDALSQIVSRADPCCTRVYRASNYPTAKYPGDSTFRDLLDTLSGPSSADFVQLRGSTASAKHAHHGSQDVQGERIRDLMDRISVGSDKAPTNRLYSKPSPEITSSLSQPDWTIGNPSARFDTYLSQAPGSSNAGTANSLIWK